MRNIMLAATAIVGISALTAGYANAQTTPQAEPVLTTDSFNSGQATGAAMAPATYTVRLRALLVFEGLYGTDSATKTAVGKNSQYYFGTYTRLYPKFDAKAANGLEYGATMEIRSNSGGVGSGGASTANTLFFRRYNGYLGTPTIGRFYVGPENNALARLAAGTTMEDFDFNGGFNGDAPAANNSNLTINFPYLRGASFYTTNKIVYLSPSFAGFTVGGSYEPSESVGETQPSTSAVLNPTTASIAGGVSRRRNTLDIAAQYKGSFGPVALTSFVGYITSGHIQDSAATAATVKFRDLKAYAGGFRMTIGPFAFGGIANAGDLNDNGNGTLLRQGQKKAQNFLAGFQYTVGPVIMGAQYVNQLSGGNYINSTNYAKSTLHDIGYSVGGAWDYAPGSTVFLNTLYSTRRQAGYNFVAGAATASNVGNTGQARGIAIGNSFKW